MIFDGFFSWEPILEALVPLVSLHLCEGIGLALAARVTEIVRERGLEQSYIGWTWLVDWYGKLGYKVWQKYILSWRRSE